MTRNWKGLAALSAAGLIALTGQAAHSAPPPTTTGAKTLAAASAGGNVKISGWATFSGVNIGAGTDPIGDAMPTGQADQVGTDLIGAQLVYRPELADLYMRWQVHKIPSFSAGVVNQVGSPGTVYVLRTEIAKIPIEIHAQSLGPTQTYQLFTCQGEGACTLAGNITGAFGTTGEEVIADVTLAQLAGFNLPLKEGDTIGTPRAFTYIAPNPAASAAGLPDALAADAIVMAKTSRVLVPGKKVTVTVGTTSKVATLDKGYFTAYVPRSAFKKNPSPVTTKTCLGPTCVSQTFTVKY